MPTSEWTPVVADVGAILRARTKDVDGNEVGTFNASTRPTEAQVNVLIGQSVGDIAIEVGEDIDAKWRPKAKELAALGTAMKIELGYFPEQVATDRSPYDRFKVLYDEGLARLEAAMEGGDVGAGGEVTGGYGFASASFPDIAVIGWGTRW